MRTRFLREIHHGNRSSGVLIAMVEYHLACGEHESALEWCEKAVEEREPPAVIYRCDSRTKALRSNPRWHDLLEKMDLPRVK